MIWNRLPLVDNFAKGFKKESKLSWARANKIRLKNQRQGISIFDKSPRIKLTVLQPKHHKSNISLSRAFPSSSKPIHVMEFSYVFFDWQQPFVSKKRSLNPIHSISEKILAVWSIVFLHQMKNFANFKHQQFEKFFWEKPG